MSKSSSKPVGIISYGSYIPSSRLQTATLDVARGKQSGVTQLGTQLISKSVPQIDEDTTTLSVMSAGQALERGSFKKQAIGSVFIGSESHPYAVKPTGVTVAAALGLSSNIAVADLEFACKAGTQSLQVAVAYAKAGLHRYGLAIGSDTAQAAPGDALEYTAAAGSAAFVVGSTDILVEVLDMVSVASDVPDFWRAAGAPFPSHAGRFTGEPAYFDHITKSATQLLSKNKLLPSQIDYCVFHTPNAKFPRQIAKRLGFLKEQLEPSLLVETVGNTYSAASLLALSYLLDTIPANKTILLSSYGSGAGSDSFLLKTTPLLVKKRKKWNTFVADQLQQTHSITYPEYLKNTTAGH